MSVEEDFNGLISFIESKLEEKGVSDAVFNPETGIIGLVDKISDIKSDSGNNGTSFTVSSSSKNKLSYFTLTALLKHYDYPIPNVPILFSWNNHTDSLLNNNENQLGYVGSSSSELSFDNNGVLVDSSSSKLLYKNYLFDVSKKSYRIELTCTKIDGVYYLISELTDENGSDEYNLSFFISDSVSLNTQNFNIPFEIGDTIDVIIELTPSIQKIYINNNLIGTTNIDYSSFSNNDYWYSHYNMLGFWRNNDSLYGIKNLKIYEFKDSITDSNGKVSWNYNSQGEGVVEFNIETETGLSQEISICDAPIRTLKLNFTGKTLTDENTNTLIGENIIINYGDGTNIEYTGNFSHNYEQNGTYDIEMINVTSLDNMCFFSNNLNSVEIPSTITSLGDGCFVNTNLSSVIISEGVKSLGETCFRMCSNLNEINIPRTITSIGQYCFEYCGSELVLRFNWKNINEIIYFYSYINDYNNLSKIIIPQGTSSLYESKGYPTNLLEEEM